MAHRNYLRVRGEYTCMKPAVTLLMELPPRARRIQIFHIPPQAVAGTTSACAENTIGKEKSPGGAWNYLRVRGEYWTALRAETLVGELPPRARRIPDTYEKAKNRAGTTSACAENTGPQS